MGNSWKAAGFYHFCVNHRWIDHFEWGNSWWPIPNQKGIADDDMRIREEYLMTPESWRGAQMRFDGSLFFLWRVSWMLWTDTECSHVQQIVSLFSTVWTWPHTVTSTESRKQLKEENKQSSILVWAPSHDSGVISYSSRISLSSSAILFWFGLGHQLFSHSEL